MRIAVTVTPADIKAEAARRIEARWPLWKQINLARAGGAELAAMAAEIDALRAASDRVEAMTPIPPDFAADRYWS